MQLYCKVLTVVTNSHLYPSGKFQNGKCKVGGIIIWVDHVLHPVLYGIIKF